MSEKRDNPFQFLKQIDQLSRVAVPSVDAERLYETQREAVQAIHDNVKAIVIDSYVDRVSRRLGSGEDGSGRGREHGHHDFFPLSGRDYRSGHVEKKARWRISGAQHSRPHNCFIINGERGSGKTTVLNHLAKRIENISFTLLEAAQRISSQPAGGLSHQMLPISQKAVLLLRVALPNNIEAHESPMEAIFAAVQDRLQQEEARTNDSTDDSKNIRETLREFEEQVLVGWTFSRREGMQALAQDSLDFHDYARNRAKFNLAAHMRIDSWLGFVDRLLDTLGFELLVVIFDDMDLQVQGGQRIVEDIQQYMVHPRTVTIVAADLDRLVECLIREAIVASPQLAKILDTVDSNHQMIDGEPSYHLKTFMHDCSRMALAKVDKVFPPGLRYDLDVRDRAGLDKLFERSFTKLCVEHFFIHKPERMVFQEASKGLAWDEGLAWWLLNAPHSALVTDTVRGYVQFLHGLFHNHFTKQGPTVTLPWKDHKPILDVLLSYHKAWDIHKLRSSAPDLLELAVQRGTGWDWDSSRQPRSTDPYIEHLIDFWLDVKIAMNGLDCQNVPSLRRWLPLDIEFVPEKVGQNLLPTPKFGINGYFQNRVLPRSCLYIYQFRYLDMLVRRLRSDLPTGARGAKLGKLAHERSNFTIHRSVVELAAQIVRNGSAPLRKLAAALEAEQDDSSPSENILVAQIALFYFLYPEDGGKLLLGLKELVKDEFQNYSWSEIESETANTWVSPFVKYLEAWYSIESEGEERDFFRTVWILAVHLGSLGADYRSIKVQQFSRDLGMGFHADETGRLARLAQHTDEIIRQRSRRTGILLAWSLRPVVGPLIRLGCDRLGDGNDKRKHWELVQAALQQALTNLDDLLPKKETSESATTPDAPAASQAVGAIQEPSKPIAPESAAEEYLKKPGQALQWHFPDFSDEQLETLRLDIEATIKAIGTGLDEAETASAPSGAGATRQKFIEVLRQLTGVSLRSAGAIHARLVRS